MGSFGLKSRAGIGAHTFSIETEPVTITGGGLDHRAEESISFGFERYRPAAAFRLRDHEIYAAARRRPDPCVRPIPVYFDTARKAARRSHYSHRLPLCPPAFTPGQPGNLCRQYRRFDRLRHIALHVREQVPHALVGPRHGRERCRRNAPAPVSLE